MRSGCVRGRGGRLRWDRSWRWVPHSRLRTGFGMLRAGTFEGSGQALRGRRDVVRQARDAMCVQGLLGADVFPSFRRMTPVFGRMSFKFRGCVHFRRAHVSRFWVGRRMTGFTEERGTGVGRGGVCSVDEGECVQSVGSDVFSFGGDVFGCSANEVSFGPAMQSVHAVPCVQFSGNAGRMVPSTGPCGRRRGMVRRRFDRVSVFGKLRTGFRMSDDAGSTRYTMNGGTSLGEGVEVRTRAMGQWTAKQWRVRADGHAAAGPDKIDPPEAAALVACHAIGCWNVQRAPHLTTPAWNQPDSHHAHQGHIVLRQRRYSEELWCQSLTQCLIQLGHDRRSLMALRRQLKNKPSRTLHIYRGHSDPCCEVIFGHAGQRYACTCVLMQNGRSPKSARFFRRRTI